MSPEQHLALWSAGLTALGIAAIAWATTSTRTLRKETVQ